MSTPRLLFYVQHLLGIGHVRRALLISRALQSAGVEVHLVLGGRSNLPMSLDGLNVHWLPSLHSDSGFSGLLDANGEIASEDYLADRANALLALDKRLQCQAVMVEMYPLGRRAFAFELEPLLAQAKARDALSLSSIRDVLVQKIGEKAQAKQSKSAQHADAVYDHILVHGDPEFIALEDSFPFTDVLQDKIHYTGLVAPDRPPIEVARKGIWVSVGGGAVGAALLNSALDALEKGDAKHLPWTLVAGPNLPDAEQQALTARAKALGATWLNGCADLPARLAGARVSISQAGYNTVCDLLAAGTPSVLVPFAEGDENEQSLRAHKLHAMGWAYTVESAQLSAENLGQAIEWALEQTPSTPLICLNGAENSARFIAERLR